jgi:ParB family chromosome partitioning protein
LAEQDTVPVRIKQMTDAEVIEAQLIELSLVVKRFLPFVGALHVVDMSTTCRVCV